MRKRSCQNSFNRERYTLFLEYCQVDRGKFLENQGTRQDFNMAQKAV
jgi:hypothetical protein